jgi:hypothetical protein
MTMVCNSVRNLMPAEAKLGLVLGIGLTITLALFFNPKSPTTAISRPGAVATEPAKEVHGQTTSNRKGADLATFA